MVIENGIGHPIHPFLCDILETYRIVPGQLTPLVWCHMAGMLMMLGDLFRKVHSVAICQHIYRLEMVRGKKGVYCVTRYLKGHDMLIEGLPTSCGDWKRKWFFLNEGSCGSTLRRHFNMARVSQTLIV